MIKSGASYIELGGDFFDRLEPERLTRYYIKAPRTPRSQGHSRNQRRL